MSEPRAGGHRSLGPADSSNSLPMCVGSPGKAIPRVTPGVGEGVAKAVLSVGCYLVRLSPVAFLPRLSGPPYGGGIVSRVGHCTVRNRGC